MIPVSNARASGVTQITDGIGIRQRKGAIILRFWNGGISEMGVEVQGKQLCRCRPEQDKFRRA